MRYVLYHKNCVDGFASAYVAWKSFRDEAQYIPVNYGEPLPEMEDYAEVYLLDFSLSMEATVHLYTRMKRVVIIDHHQQAKDILSAVKSPNMQVIFHEHRSGAILTWHYFFPSLYPPLLIEYVQDRDLWTKKLRGCDAVASLLFSNYLPSGEPRTEDFKAFDYLTMVPIDDLIEKGSLMEEIKAKSVERLCKNVFFTTINGNVIPTVNSPINQSEIGHRLCELFPEAPFTAIYYDKTADERIWSLRSTKGKATPAAVALGGGGHPSGNTAGFISHNINLTEQKIAAEERKQ